MKNITLIMSLILTLSSLQSCDEKKEKQSVKEIENKKLIVEKVDETQSEVSKGLAGLDMIATLDHHRMAQEEKVYTPPAIASIFSDSKINIDLLEKADPLLGLDLPFKVLVYSEADTSKVSVAYTSGDFIAKRHGMAPEVFSAYNTRLASVLASVDDSMISKTNIDSVQKGFGIVEIKSDYDYATTLQHLKDIVMAQSDTRWFGELDYQAAGVSAGIELNPNTLLLFGGPAPGGKAMMTSPKIGLDAFCQKLLVYEGSDGHIWVAFNDIVAFANLYYNTATKPQMGINQRLIATFTKAVQKTKS